MSMRSCPDMPCHIGLKVKIYLSDEQKRIVAINDGAKRAVYNHLVAAGNEKYHMAKTDVLASIYQDRLDYVYSTTKNVRDIQNVLPFLYEDTVDSQTVANAIKNYHAAWKNMREQHTGVPTFKKKSYTQSYQTNPHYEKKKDGTYSCNVRFVGLRHVTLPKLGRVRFGGSPKLIEAFMKRTSEALTGESPHAARIGTITISRDSVGEYWASFALASEEPFCEELPKTGSQHGIDLNLIELVNFSDGEAVPNMKFYAESHKRLAKQQRKLNRQGERAKKDSRELFNSKNYQKQRKRVAETHRKIARQREDYLHNISKREVENQDFIAAEDLKVSNLLKNHCLAKAIADAGWRKLLTMLQYKGEFYGKTVILVPPKNTTQTCSKCGYKLIGKDMLTLMVRDWTCPRCGTHHLRDTNAAQNILNKGLKIASQSES